MNHLDYHHYHHHHYLHYRVGIRDDVVDNDHGDSDGDEECEERGHVVLVHPQEVSLVQNLHMHVLCAQIV